jgi:hypothetical protein
MDRSHLASGVAIAYYVVDKLCPKLDFARTPYYEKPGFFKKPGFWGVLYQ